MPKNRGNGRHAPTPSKRAVVKALASFGINQEHIAAKLDCNVSTLQKNYKKELAESLNDMIAKVAQSLYRRAIDPKSGMAGVKAAELILKARGGWRDGSQTAGTADDGAQGSGNQQVILILPENSRDIPQLARRAGMQMIEAQPVIEGEIIESE
jgi:hypothetical protein